MTMTAWYRFDNDVTDSAGVNHGTASNIAYSPFRVEGATSAYFNGTSSNVVATDAAALDMGTGDFSINLWFAGEAGTTRYFLCKNGGTPYRGYTFYINSANKPAFVWWGSTTAQDATNLTALPTVSNYSWHMYTLIVNRAGNVIQYYYDGAQHGADVAETDVGNIDSTVNLYIGSTLTPDNWLKGYMDDVRIYPGTVLTTAEITALYNSRPVWERYRSRWTLDNTANDANAINNGTASNVTYVTSPKINDGYAGSFLEASDSKISCSDSDSLDPGAGDFTVSAWLYPVAGNSKTEGIVSKMGDAASENYAGWQILAAWSGSVHTLQSYVKDTSGNTVYDDNNLYTLVNGKWQHVVFTISGNNTYLYVNGAQVSTEAGTIATVATGQTFYIGYRDIDTSQESWNGYIDDVRLYNVALTAAEVRGLYNSYYKDSKYLGGSNL